MKKIFKSLFGLAIAASLVSCATYSNGYEDNSGYYDGYYSNGYYYAPSSYYGYGGYYGNDGYYYRDNMRYYYDNGYPYYIGYNNQRIYLQKTQNGVRETPNGFRTQTRQNTSAPVYRNQNSATTNTQRNGNGFRTPNPAANSSPRVYPQSESSRTQNSGFRGADSGNLRSSGNTISTERSATQETTVSTGRSGGRR